MRSNKFKRFPFLYYSKNMIYFTDIYGLYSLMVVMLFECELRLVRWFSVIGRYCHDISNWDEKRKILCGEHYKKGTESDCYLLNLINGVQWLWGGHRRTRTVKDRTALSRSCPTGQTDRQRIVFSKVRTESRQQTDTAGHNFPDTGHNFPENLDKDEKALSAVVCSVDR